MGNIGGIKTEQEEIKLFEEIARGNTKYSANPGAMSHG